MKAFKLNEARRGDAVMYPSGHPVKYIGQSSTGAVVIEDLDGYFIACGEDELRMAPKKMKFRVAAIEDEDGELRPVVASSSIGVENAQSRYNFVGWVHEDWQEVEISKVGLSPI